MRSVKHEFISAGLIWQNQEGKWCKKCPLCYGEQSYCSYSECIYRLRIQTRCNSCAKKGTNNPSFGKSPSIITREKISCAGKGKHKIPCSLEKRKTISDTKRKNNDGLLSQNGNNQFKRKPYIFPNGRIELVQGYEPWTLDYLITSSISPDDIIIKGDKRPVIHYTWNGTDNRYLPDCYISSSNMLVETKSTWTWSSRLEQNNAKITGSLKSGYNIRVIIWYSNKNLISDQIYSLKSHII